MSADSSELSDLAERLASVASAGYAVPTVEFLAETWEEVSQREVPVDTGQTKARTAVSHVSGTAASARAEVVSDTPYAGWVEFRWKPYFTMGQRAALDAVDEVGAAIRTDVRRVLQSGGHPNPRSLMR